MLNSAGEIVGNLNRNCSSDMEGKQIVIPKPEVLDYELPPYSTCPAVCWRFVNPDI